MKRRALILGSLALSASLLLSACGLLPEEDDRQSSELPEGTAYLQLLAGLPARASS